MTIAAEHQFKNCTCGSGMRDGLRCPDCNGQGFVRTDHVFGSNEPVTEVPEAETEDEDEPTDNRTLAEVRARADELGIPSGGNRKQIAARVRAHEASLTEASVDETESAQ